MAPSTDPTVVLVHGPWADGLSFAAVAWELLRAHRRVVLAPDLIHGVASDTRALVDFLAQATSGPVVLAAHSYGGILITGAANHHPEAKALVYIDALAPDRGESARSLITEMPGSLLDVPDPTTVFDFVRHGPEAPREAHEVYVKQDVYHRVFADGLSTREAVVLAAMQRPATVGALTEPFAEAPAWRRLPSFFFIGSNDSVIPPPQLRRMAKRAGSVVSEEWAPHLAMVKEPQKVTRLISDAMSAVTPTTGERLE